MSIEPPPLAAWPSRALPQESAQGLFLRIAKLNGQVSARTLAEFVGLNGRAPNSEALLDFCLRFPIENSGEMVGATPTVAGGLVTLYGQTFTHGSDFSFKRPRVCPDCLAESRHYRNWFDVQAISTCPIHSRLLVGASGERLAWWNPQIGVSPNGIDLAQHGASGPSVSVQWDRYVLARMGLCQADAIPFLDNTSMHGVIRAAVWLGQFELEESPKRQAGRALLAAAGFDVLRLGQEGVREFFAAAIRRQAGGERWVTVEDRRTLGSRSAVTDSSGSQLIEEIRQARREAVAESGFYPRKAGSESRLPTGHLRLGEVAQQLGLRPPKVLQIAMRLGLTQRVQSAALGYSFSRDAVECIAASLQETLSATDTASRLGLPEQEVQVLVRAQVLRPFLRLRGNSRTCHRFLAADVDALLQSIRPPAHRRVSGISFSECCRRRRCREGRLALRVVSGRLRVVGWDDIETGFRACLIDEAGAASQERRRKTWNGLPKADVAAELGVRASVIPELVRRGHLEVLPAQAGVLSGVCPTSLERFRKEHVAAVQYAHSMGISPLRVYAALDAAGVRSLPLGISCRFVRRDEVARLRPDLLLQASCGEVGEEFWGTLAKHLSATGSKNRLVRAGQGIAKLRAGEGRFSVALEFCPTSATVALSFVTDGRVSPVRYATVTGRLGLFKERWPMAKVEMNEARSEVIFREMFRLGTANLGDETASRVACLLDARTTMIRALLREQPPEAVPLTLAA